MTSFRSLDAYHSALNKDKAKDTPPLFGQKVGTRRMQELIEQEQHTLEKKIINEIIYREAPAPETNSTLQQLDMHIEGMRELCTHLLDMIPSLGWSAKREDNSVLEEFYTLQEELQQLTDDIEVSMSELHESAQQFPSTYGPIEWEYIRELLHLMMQMHTRIKHDLRYTAGRPYRDIRLAKERNVAEPFEDVTEPTDVAAKFGTEHRIFHLDFVPKGDSFRELLVLMDHRMRDLLKGIMGNYAFLKAAHAKQRLLMTTTTQEEQTSSVSKYLQGTTKLQEIENHINEASLLGMEDWSMGEEGLYGSSKDMSVEEYAAYEEFFSNHRSILGKEVAFGIYKRMVTAFPLYLFNLRRFQKQKSLERIRVQSSFLKDMWDHLNKNERTALHQQYTVLLRAKNTLINMPELVEAQYQLVQKHTRPSVATEEARKRLQKWFDEAQNNLQDLIGQIERVYGRLKEQKRQEVEAKELRIVWKKPAQEPILFPREIENCLYELQNLLHGATPDKTMAVSMDPLDELLHNKEVDAEGNA